MSYLKLFPRLLVLERDHLDGYVGKILYDLEQYGQMRHGYETSVLLNCKSWAELDWYITGTELTSHMVGFDCFFSALSHYLFEVLRFDPVTQGCKSSQSQFEFHFRSVYFHMGLNRFISNRALGDSA